VLNATREPLIKSDRVIPAKAGIQRIKALDTGFRRCDDLFSVSLGDKQRGSNSQL
jgi:hypothetical protein